MPTGSESDKKLIHSIMAELGWTDFRESRQRRFTSIRPTQVEADLLGPSATTTEAPATGLHGERPRRPSTTTGETEEHYQQHSAPSVSPARSASAKRTVNVGEAGSTTRQARKSPPR